jgi:hypothetical protein
VYPPTEASCTLGSWGILFAQEFSSRDTSGKLSSLPEVRGLKFQSEILASPTRPRLRCDHTCQDFLNLTPRGVEQRDREVHAYIDSVIDMIDASHSR